MSIWVRIYEALTALANGEGLGTILDRLRADPGPERSVGFTIAVIALGAKMAKADGEVTRDEVHTFRRIFEIPPGEEAHAAQVFNLARQDVAGFNVYARKVAALFNTTGSALCADDRNVLIDQTMVNDFRPFGAAMAKLSTNAKTIERQDGTSVDLTLALDRKRRIDTAFEVYLGLYQAITGPD